MTTKKRYQDYIFQEPVETEITVEELIQAMVKTGIKPSIKTRIKKEEFDPLHILAISLGAREKKRNMLITLFNIYGIDYIKGWYDGFHKLEITKGSITKRKIDNSEDFKRGYQSGLQSRRNTKFIEIFKSEKRNTTNAKR